MGGKDLILGHVDGGAQVKIVAAPGRNVLIEHLLDGLRNPGWGMHAVGDGVDGEFREHATRDFGVLHGHAVGVAGEAQGQQGHIQHAIAKTALLFKASRAVAAQDADGLLGGETVVAGGHRGMGGEDAPLPHLFDVGFRGRAQRPAAQLALKQRQRQQRRVALIHMKDIDPVAQSAGHAQPAHAENNLLLQAVVGVAAVEVVSQPAVPAGVALQVGIEQKDGHHMSVAAGHVVAPGAHRHNAVLDRDCHPGWLLGAEIGGVPRLHFFGLQARGVEVLLKVALAMQQRKGNQRNAQVGGGAKRVAGQNSQAAGVGGHGWVDGNFHGEICHQAGNGKSLV